MQTIASLRAKTEAYMANTKEGQRMTSRGQRVYRVTNRANGISVYLPYRDSTRISSIASAFLDARKPGLSFRLAFWNGKEWV